MTTLVLSILDGSSSFLHIIRTAIKAWMSLDFAKIPSPILELKIDGYCCDCTSVYICDWIFFTLSSNMNKHKSLDEFEILQDPTKYL